MRPKSLSCYQQPGNQAAADTLVQRVLAPLRCKAARDTVEIREIRSAEELKDDPGDVCIVYRGVIRTPRDAEKVIDQCQQLGVPFGLRHRCGAIR